MACASSLLMTIGAYGPDCILVVRLVAVFLPVRELSSNLSIREMNSSKVLRKLGGTWLESLGTIWGIMGLNCSIVVFCVWKAES